MAQNLVFFYSFSENPLENEPAEIEEQKKKWEIKVKTKKDEEEEVIKKYSRAEWMSK